MTQFCGVVIGISVLTAGCVYQGPSSQALHVVHGELVHSPAPSELGYAAYLRCRMALEADPPRLDEAKALIEQALRAERRDPHLWTVQAQIATRQGRRDAALTALHRALELRPDYPPAQALATRLAADSRHAAATPNQLPRG